MPSAMCCPAKRSRRSGRRRSRRSRQLDPQAAERQVVDFWAAFLAPAVKFQVPDPVLNDIFLSRLTTRAILEVNLNKELSYTVCSPIFLF